MLTRSARLPALVGGSLLIGAWTTKLILNHPSRNKGTVFILLGIAFGVICCAIMYLVVGIIGGFPVDHPDDLTEWFSSGLLASIPIVYVTIASWITWQSVKGNSF